MGNTESKETDENSKKMIETIEKLQGKIGELENAKTKIEETKKSEKPPETQEKENKAPSPEIKPPESTEQKEENMENENPENKKPEPQDQQQEDNTISPVDQTQQITTPELKQPKLNEPQKQINDYTKPPKIVTTEDIKFPNQTKQIVREWNLDPLIEIPGDTESIIILMKWLQSLIDKCGRQNLSNILDYYVDIGWISDDVKISLIDYSQGITGDEKTLKEVSDLPSKDHIESLLFIQKLKGIQFDKHFIDRIEGEITRMTKKVSNYNSK